jgi:1-acyl-sn-glycerol-3-phosphate acyltransferase
MDKLLSYLYGLYFLLSSAVFVAGAAIVCALTFPFDRNRKLLHLYACCWGHHYIRINPFWRCTFEGVDNIDSRTTYVLVANHQSLWDIMVLYGLFKPFKWVSKASVMRIPFIGWNMLLNQYVHVARGDLKSIKEMMESCRQWLRRGASILIFPEGTRSETSHLGAFRDGPFRLAVDCNVAIVPIVVDGTFEVFSKKSDRINFHQKITVKVLSPVHPAQYGSDFRALREHVRLMMAKSLSDARQNRSV